MSDYKGYISIEHTVWCGGDECFKWERFTEPTKALTAREARRGGWVLTRARGWLCKSCARKPVTG